MSKVVPGVKTEWCTQQEPMLLVMTVSRNSYVISEDPAVRQLDARQTGAGNLSMNE